MSKTIEQKIVEMRFDNSNFEKNVSTSMNSLNRLQETINKTASGNSFANLGKAANNLSFSGLTGSIQTITEKFSWMEQIAIGALRNIGASIEQHLVDALKKVTIDNIALGFSKYGTITEATQTIMSSLADVDLGEGIDKLDYVEGLLEKLAWFSDETSYGLTDMTDNIAKFTAAGLDLDTSTNAMMGIAAWAANSGQNAQVAARAMYQLSQAMGQGTIQLMDWKSIETANMGTKEVKELLLEYGALHGELQKIGEGKYALASVGDVSKLSEEELEKVTITYANFRNHLSQEKWLTAEIFSDAMGEYGAYANALHSIIENEENDIDNASELIGYLDKAIAKSKETGKSIEDIMKEDYHIDIMVEDEDGTLHSALEGVTELSIRAMKASQQARTWQQVVDSVVDAASTKWMGIFQLVFGNVEEATELFTELSEYLWTVFVGPIDNLKELFKGWSELEGRSLLFDIDNDNDTVSALENLEEALTALLDSISKGFSNIIPPMTSEKLLEITKRFRDWTGTLILSEDQSEKLSKKISDILNVFGVLFERLKVIWGIAKNIFKAIWTTGVNAFEAIKRVFLQIRLLAFGVFGKFSELEPLKKGVSSFFTSFYKAINIVLKSFHLSEGALTRLGNIFNSIKIVLNTVGELFGKLGEKINSIGPNKLTKVFGKFLSGDLIEFLLFIPEKIGKAIEAIIDFIKTNKTLKDILNGISASVMKIPFDKIKEKVSTIVNSVKEFVKNSEAFKGIEGFTNWIRDAFKGIKEFFKTLIFGVDDSSKEMSLIQKVAEKVRSIFGVIGKVFEYIARALPAILMGLGGVSIGRAVTSISNFLAAPFGKMFSGLKDFVSEMSDSISVLTSALKLEQLGEVLKKVILSLSVFLLALAVSVYIISSVKNPEKLPDLLGSIAFFVGELFGGMLLLIKAMDSQKIKSAIGSAKNLKGLALIIAAMGAAVLLISLAVSNMVKAIDGKSNDTIVIAISSIALLLGEIAGITMLLMSLNTSKTGGKALKGVALTLAAMSVAILILSKVIKQLGELPTEQLVKGEIAVGALIILVGLFTLMAKNSKKMVGVGLGLILMAVAVKTLANVAKDLGKVPINDLIKGIIAIGAISLIMVMLTYVSSESKHMVGAGIGLVLIAAAVSIIANVAIKISSIPINDLIKGIIAIGAISLIMVMLTYVSSESKHMVGAGIGLVLIAAAVSIIANVAIKLGEIPLNNLIQGVVAIAAITLLMSLLMVVASNSSGLILASAALLIMAGAIAIIGTILLMLASFGKSKGGLKGILIAVGALVVVLAALVAVAYLVSGVAVPFLVFAAAVAVLGVGLLAISAAIYIFVSALLLMVGAAGLTVGAITLAITNILSAIVESAPALILAIGTVINAILIALDESVIPIVETLLKFISVFLEKLEEYVPGIIESLDAILNPILDFVLNLIYNALMTIVDMVLGGGDYEGLIPKILTGLENAGLQLIAIIFGGEGHDGLIPSILNGLYNGLMTIVDMIFGGGEYEGLIPRILRGLEESVELFIATGLNIMTAIKDGLLDGIELIVGSNEKKGALAEIIDAICQGIVSSTDSVMQSVIDLINGLAESIETHSAEFWKAVKRLCRAIINAFLGIFNGEDGSEMSIFDVGANLIEGLKKGILDTWEKVKKTVIDPIGKVVKGIADILGVSSPSWKAEKIGAFFMDGLGLGFEDGLGGVTDTAEKSGQSILDAFGSALSDGTDIFDSEDAGNSILDAFNSAISDGIDIFDSDITGPIITPVVDLSQVRSGALEANNMFSNGSYMSVSDSIMSKFSSMSGYSPYVYEDGTLKVDAGDRMSNSMTALEKKMDDLILRFSGVKVVMDNGALVGQLVDPLDRALGQKTLYASRGSV